MLKEEFKSQSTNGAQARLPIFQEISTERCGIRFSLVRTNWIGIAQLSFRS